MYTYQIKNTYDDQFSTFSVFKTYLLNQKEQLTEEKKSSKY